MISVAQASGGWAEGDLVVVETESLRRSIVYFWVRSLRTGLRFSVPDECLTRLSEVDAAAALLEVA